MAWHSVHIQLKQHPSVSSDEGRMLFFLLFLSTRVFLSLHLASPMGLCVEMHRCVWGWFACSSVCAWGLYFGQASAHTATISIPINSRAASFALFSSSHFQRPSPPIPLAGTFAFSHSSALLRMTLMRILLLPLFASFPFVLCVVYTRVCGARSGCGPMILTLHSIFSAALSPPPPRPWESFAAPLALSFLGTHAYVRRSTG